MRTHGLPEDEPVDVPGEHGGGRQHRGVRRGHHRRRYRAQPEKCNVPGHVEIQLREYNKRKYLNTAEKSYRKNLDVIEKCNAKKM